MKRWGHSGLVLPGWAGGQQGEGGRGRGAAGGGRRQGEGSGRGRGAGVRRCRPGPDGQLQCLRESQV